MYLELDSKDKESVALMDSEGTSITYGGILGFAEKWKKSIKDRVLVFILSRNCVGAAAGYLGTMINHIVPLMLGAGMDQGLLKTLTDIYGPSYVWKPVEMVGGRENILLQEYGYALVATGLPSCPMYEELSLLLTTSGSTGSPKLVRHSYGNLEEHLGLFWIGQFRAAHGGSAHSLYLWAVRLEQPSIRGGYGAAHRYERVKSNVLGFPEGGAGQ